MSRSAVASAALLLIVLPGLTPLASGDGGAAQAVGERLRASTILAAPDRYQGKEVVIRGRILEVARAVFPNGRPYHTLSVGDGRATIAVFAWETPSVRQGDEAEVAGIFYTWRFNLRHVIDSRRVTRIAPSGGLPPAAGQPAGTLQRPR